jgi:hypothetical protein
LHAHILGGEMKRITCFRILAWLALVFFSGVLIYNGLPYLSAPRTHAFVWEKGALADRPVWLITLVIHVIAGMVCLLSSMLQFFRPLLRKFPGMHRWLGRLYVCSVLVFLCPTGFYLAFFAHGGMAGTTGFLILGVLTTLTTWKGWIAMRRHQLQQHIAWMIRSFAMATTALSFRVEHIIFQEVGLSPETGFLVALYLSIIGNAVVAEALLWLMRKKKNKNQNNIKNYENETVNHVPAVIG